MSDYVATVDAGTAAGRVIADSMGETLDRIAAALEALVEQGRKPVRWEYQWVADEAGLINAAAKKGYRVAHHVGDLAGGPGAVLMERPIYEEQP